MTGVVLTALLFWVCVFSIFFTSQGVTPIEFFFGRYEPLPEDLDIWKVTASDLEKALVREERLISPHAAAGYLLRQVRYRDAATQTIVRVEAEQRVPRRRVSVRSGE